MSAPFGASILQPNRAEIAVFVKALFPYADSDTYASLRGFPQSKSGGPPVFIRPVHINGSLDPLIEVASIAAFDAANGEHPAVFAPPICTFSNADHARTADLANGVALSVEIDEGDTIAAWRRLEGLLGKATMVVASGGEWIDSQTGEIFPKLHFHWRLSEPTRTPEDHGILRQARDLAARLAGADPSSKAIVHPLRWPGSWHLKGEPRLARIRACNPDAEIHLAEAVDALSGAIETAGLASAGLPRSSSPVAATPRLISAMEFLPNPGTAVHYDQWIRLGYAVHNATAGTGFEIWRAWSAKSDKYDEALTRKTWDAIAKAIAASPVKNPIGAGTIFFHALGAGWVDPDRPPPPENDPPAPHPDDPGYELPATGGDAELILCPGTPLVSAREFLRLAHTEAEHRTLHHQNATFYSWAQTHYTEATQEEVRARLYGFLDKARRPAEKRGLTVPFSPTKPKVANVLEALAAAAQLPHTAKPPAWLDAEQHPPADELISCTNGLLHLPTRLLLPHSPAFFSLNALEFAYQPDAPQPIEWLKFLDQLWPEDPQSIDMLQEAFGLLLTGDTSHQKAFLLVGPKRSGKGTIARVATKLLGQASVCGPTLSSLGQNFGLAPLISKRLAIISDARLGGKTDQQVVVERILAITGEDSISIDRKFKDAWTGRLETRIMVLTNELPKLADASGALASRFLILLLTNSFYGNEDHGLTDRIIRELTGILNWSLEGWQRLKDRGYFVQPVSSSAARRDFEDLGSPIGAFVRERCTLKPFATCRPEDLYNNWCEWCREQNDTHVGTVQTFGRDLRAVVAALKFTHPRDANGTPVRHYQGIGLKERS